MVKYFQRYSNIPGVIVKLGAHGVIVGAEGITLHYPAIAVSEVTSVTGAGDSLAAGTIWALLNNSKNSNNLNSLHLAIKFGLAAANLSLKSKDAINPIISPVILHQIVHA